MLPMKRYWPRTQLRSWAATLSVWEVKSTSARYWFTTRPKTTSNLNLFGTLQRTRSPLVALRAHRSAHRRASQGSLAPLGRLRTRRLVPHRIRRLIRILPERRPLSLRQGRQKQHLPNNSWQLCHKNFVWREHLCWTVRLRHGLLDEVSNLPSNSLPTAGTAGWF
jgi:hypothetical protein